MIKTIKNSLWMKTFLSLTILLFAVSFLLYGIVTAVMPASYRSQQTLGYTEQMGRLEIGRASCRERVYLTV